MKTHSKVVSLFITVVLLAGVISQQRAIASPPDVLRAMPSKAMLIAATQPINVLEPKIIQFASTAGIPVTPDKLNIKKMFEDGFRTEFGCELGLDTSRGLGLVLTNIMLKEKGLAIYIPVKDPAKVIASITADKKTRVSNTKNVWKLGGDTFAMTTGNYLVISPAAAALISISNMSQGVQLDPADTSLFSTSDAAATLQLGSLMPMLQGLAAMATMNPELQKKPLAVNAINMLVSRVTELNKLSLGAALPATGIKLKMNFQAKPGSTLAGYLTKYPTTDISALNKLPAQGALAAYVLSLDKNTIAKISSDLLDALAGGTLAGKINQQDLAKLKNLIPIMQTTKGSMALYAPQNGTKGMDIAYIANIPNLQSIINHYGQMCTLITKLSKQAGYPLIMNYVKSAGTIQGTAYDTMTIDLSQLPVPPETKKAMAKIYGSGNKPAINYQFVNKGNTMYMAVGNTAQTIGNALDIAKSSTSTLANDASITKTAQQLPKQANAFIFINVGKYAQWAMNLGASQMPANGTNGDQAQAKAKMQMMSSMFGQIKGTIGIATTTENGLLKTETFIPTETIQSGMQSFMTMMMMSAMSSGQQQPSHKPAQQQNGF